MAQPTHRPHRRERVLEPESRLYRKSLPRCGSLRPRASCPDKSEPSSSPTDAVENRKAARQYVREIFPVGGRLPVFPIGMNGTSAQSCFCNSTQMRRWSPGSPLSSQAARNSSIRELVGQPSQPAFPSARMAWLPYGFVFGIDRSINVQKRLQPPLSGGPWLLRRRMTVPKSISCRSTFIRRGAIARHRSWLGCRSR